MIRETPEASQDQETTMNALAYNSIAQTRPAFSGACKLAVCASLALVITMLSARLISHSVVTQAAVQPSAAAQLVAPLTPPSSGATVAATHWMKI